jgi:hypothetical protein
MPNRLVGWVFVALLIVFAVWTALGALWRQWPALGLGAFCFFVTLVVLVSIVAQIESRRDWATRVLAVLLALALAAVTETAVQQIVIGAIDASARELGVGVAWIAAAVGFAVYLVRSNWLGVALSLLHRSR